MGENWGVYKLGWLTKKSISEEFTFTVRSEIWEGPKEGQPSCGRKYVQRLLKKEKVWHIREMENKYIIQGWTAGFKIHLSLF